MRNYYCLVDFYWHLARLLILSQPSLSQADSCQGRHVRFLLRGMGQGAEGKKVTEREAVFWSGKL